MIIFYEKDTGKIIGKIDGRVHDKHVLDNAFISHGDDTKIGKYVVPFKNIRKEIEKPIMELRVVDKKTMRVDKVQIGTKKVSKSMGTVPDVPFSDIILDVENGKARIFDYKVKLNSKKEVINIEK